MAAEAQAREQPTNPEPELSADERQRREAAMALVRRLGDPVLRTRALAVTQFDGQLREQADRMRELMDGALGVGLAATQVGIVERLLVYRVEHDSPIVALINPDIVWRGKELEIGEEGCLSIPGIHVEVERNVHVRVNAVDETGAPLEVEASGLEARVLQHEIDHLDGVLMIDRTTREQRRDAMREWRERQQAE
jgi:peptide deformylase